MSKQPNPIKSIWGQEPLREGEYPQHYIVGSPVMSGDIIVTKIEFREDNYGDHGLGWFDIWAETGLIASMSARAVSEIHYFSE